MHGNLTPLFLDLLYSFLVKARPTATGNAPVPCIHSWPTRSEVLLAYGNRQPPCALPYSFPVKALPAWQQVPVPPPLCSAVLSQVYDPWPTVLRHPPAPCHSSFWHTVYWYRSTFLAPMVTEPPYALPYFLAYNRTPCALLYEVPSTP